MDAVISFFRDTLSGWTYFLYALVCLILILAIVGSLGDKKKKEVQDKKRAQKKYELESGEAAKKASLEGKQIIDVLDTIPTPVAAPVATPEAPAVLEISDAGVTVTDSVSILGPTPTGEEVPLPPSLASVVAGGTELGQQVIPEKKEEIGTLVLNSEDVIKK